MSAARGQEALENQAGLNGFAEPHLVCQEDAWNLPIRNFVENVELMRNQVDATAKVTAHGRLAKTGLGFEGAQAQVEDFGRIGLSSEQAFGR